MCYFGGRSYETPWRGGAVCAVRDNQSHQHHWKRKDVKEEIKAVGWPNLLMGGRGERGKRIEGESKSHGVPLARWSRPDFHLTVMTRGAVKTNSLKLQICRQGARLWEGFQSGMRGFCPKETPAKCRGQFHGLWEKRNSPNSFSWRQLCILLTLPSVSLFGSDFCPRWCWWHSGWESTCQWRGHGLNLFWSGKMPRTRTTKPMCPTTEACML